MTDISLFNFDTICVPARAHAQTNKINSEIKCKLCGGRQLSLPIRFLMADSTTYIFYEDCDEIKTRHYFK